MSESTAVRVGLVVAFLLPLVGCVWWASAITTKLDNIQQQQATILSMMRSQNTEIEALKAWKAVIERSGSPQIDDIKREITELRKDLATHMAATRP